MSRARSLFLVPACCLAFVGFGLLVFLAYNPGGKDPPAAALQQATAEAPNAAEVAAAHADLPVSTAPIVTPSAASVPTAAPTKTDAAPTPAPIAAASTVADRSNCTQIRGTDYVSDTERKWFAANCVSAPQPPASLVVFSNPQPQTASTQPASNVSTSASYASALAPLKDNYVTQVNFLVALLGIPNIKDPNWRVSVLQTTQELKTTGATIRQLDAPACQIPIEAGVLAGVVQVDNASTMVATAAQRQDPVPMASARSALQAGANAVNRAGTQAQVVSC